MGKMTDFELKKVIKRVIYESYYSPLSMDEKIREEISPEDKKILYNLVMIGDKEAIISKIRSITNKLIAGNLGEKNKNYIIDYLKRMVGRMMMTKNS